MKTEEERIPAAVYVREGLHAGLWFERDFSAHRHVPEITRIEMMVGYANVVRHHFKLPGRPTPKPADPDHWGTLMLLALVDINKPDDEKNVLSFHL